MTATVRFGIDTLLTQHLTSLRGLRIGLVTNDAATTVSLPRPMTPVRRALQQAGVKLDVLFSPEHGMGAGADDGARIGDARDGLTGLPIYSLYGAIYRPTPAQLANLDLLLFDIPDIGTRFYTYSWTLSHVLEACAEAGLPLWVLDRPNPLGGDLALAEGPILDEAQISTFVGRWAMPIRHSLTLGELARCWNGERRLGVDLTVIPVEGWRRNQQWSALAIPFVPTSPAMPNAETALIYPGICLFEGTNLSEGRGTSTPFRVIGAPWLDGWAAADRLNAQTLPGVVARAVPFTPNAGKYAGQLCQGVMLHVLDEQTFRPVATGLHLLATVTRQHPQHFQWLPYPTAVNAAGHGHFDRLIGNVSTREELQCADGDMNALIAQWTAPRGWTTLAQPYLLYQ
ncbi:MAG: DUF1343 domain-containing protein [Caldilinea sp. CFX5]|nr:DUF1343 domain-containing protein [Caldilinea sp. CFX5]